MVSAKLMGYGTSKRPKHKAQGYAGICTHIYIYVHICRGLTVQALKARSLPGCPRDL